MNNQPPSRFITYPDVVEFQGNPTICLVDAELEDVANLASFCTVSTRDYDVYLYTADKHDLEYLNYICDRSQQIFIREGSEVTINGGAVIYYNSLDALREYFTKIDLETVD